MNLKHIQRASKCPNCDTPLDEEKDNFCSFCGQLNNTRKESALEMVRELAGDFLHLDSKVTRNLSPLLFKPGRLTIDYLAGKRARYFHPVRLFLIVTVIMFLVRGFTDKKESTLMADDMSIELNTKNGFQVNKDTTDEENSVTWELGNASVPQDTLRKYVKELGIDNSEKLLDTLGVEKNFWSRLIVSQLIKSEAQGFDKLSDYYKHKLPWIIFSLMPVFAFVMWLVYIRRKIYFSDHLVYAFHLHTATFLIIALVSVLSMISGKAKLIYLAMPVYYFTSLKNVYQQSWGKTLVKGILIGVIYLIAGVLTLSMVMILLLLLF